MVFRKTDNGKALFLVSSLFLFILLLTTGVFAQVHVGLDESATDDFVSYGVFKQYETVQLVQTCDNVTGQCDLCNVTSVLAPNSSFVVQDVVMIHGNSDFTYTLNGQSQEGVYQVNGVCEDFYNRRTWVYRFTVNPVGGAEKTTLSFSLIFILGALLLLVALLSENYIFAILSGMLLAVSGIYATIYGFGGVQNVWTQIPSAVLMGIGMILMVISAFEYLKSFEDSGGEDD